MIIAPFGLGFKIAGAFIFGCGLLAICEEELNLVTGKFGMLYDGSWNLRQILSIFVANLLGVLTIFIIRRLDFMPELIYECASPIIESRDAELWYQHIIGGMGCGICIQMAVNNWKAKNKSLGVILPVMIFILCGFEHCIATSFYSLWGPLTFKVIIQIIEIFIGNLIGSFIIIFGTTGSFPKIKL